MAIPIAPDHDLLLYVQPGYLSAVDQDIFGRQPQSFDGTAHGFESSPVDVEAVDLRHLDPDHRVGQGAPPDLTFEPPALDRGEPLRIVDAS